MSAPNLLLSNDKTWRSLIVACLDRNVDLCQFRALISVDIGPFVSLH